MSERMPGPTVRDVKNILDALRYPDEAWAYFRCWWKQPFPQLKDLGLSNGRALVAAFAFLFALPVGVGFFIVGETGPLILFLVIFAAFALTRGLVGLLQELKRGDPLIRKNPRRKGRGRER